jgi:hypothetical protein
MGHCSNFPQVLAASNPVPWTFIQQYIDGRQQWTSANLPEVVYINNRGVFEKW